MTGRLTQKDRRLLKMILVIFISFLVCYLPITIVKVSTVPIVMERTGPLHTNWANPPRHVVYKPKKQNKRNVVCKIDNVSS